MTEFIMPCNMFDRREPDCSFIDEYKAATKFSTVHLFNIENLISGSGKIFNNLPYGNGKEIVYHGWMMTYKQYTEFHSMLEDNGYKLINNPSQYIGCHHFNNWYDIISDLTPESIIIKVDSINIILEQIIKFQNKVKSPLIIKDYVSSLKHNWNDACFIPKDSDLLSIAKIISMFLKIKEEYGGMQGDIVIRKFVNLKQIGVHDKSSMPISREFRTFIYKGNIIDTSEYWDQGKYYGSLPPSNFINEIADRVYSKIGSNLFTIDISQLEDDSWICIEVGDGQVSSLPSSANKEKFFNMIKDLT